MQGLNSKDYENNGATLILYIKGGKVKKILFFFVK